MPITPEVLPTLLIGQLKLYSANHSSNSTIVAACGTLATNIQSELGLTTPCPQCGALGFTDINGLPYDSTIGGDMYICETCDGQTATVVAKVAVRTGTGYGQYKVDYV